MTIDRNRDEHEAVVPIVEEEAVVTKRAIERVGLRVHQTSSTREEIAEGTGTRVHAEVERVPVNREVREVPGVRTEGDLLYIPVVEEEVVVTKRLILKEEIVVRRTVETETVRVPVTLRRTEVTVERDPMD